MNTILIPFLLTLVGAYVAYRLAVSYGEWKSKKEKTSKLAGLLRNTLPKIMDGLENAYLFPSDVNPLTSLIEENKLALEYIYLPENIKKQIAHTIESLNEFVVEFIKLRKHLLSYFERMENKIGQGNSKITTIVATKLICFERIDIPSEKILINFPRESRGHFSQTQCQPQDLIGIWLLGSQGNAEEFKIKRNNALDCMINIDNRLKKLHKI